MGEERQKEFCVVKAFTVRTSYKKPQAHYISFFAAEFNLCPQHVALVADEGYAEQIAARRYGSRRSR